MWHLALAILTSSAVKLHYPLIDKSKSGQVYDSKHPLSMDNQLVNVQYTERLGSKNEIHTMETLAREEGIFYLGLELFPQRIESTQFWDASPHRSRRHCSTRPHQ